MYQSTGGRVIPVTPSDTNYITSVQWTVESNEVQTATAVDLSANTLTLAGNGLANGDIIVPTNLGTVTGTGFAINQPLWAVGVSGNDFQVALSYGGSAIDLGGATTTLPSWKKSQDITSPRSPGFLYVGGEGDVAILPEGHQDTNTTTEADMGVQILSGVPAGSFLPVKVKKVFSTGTTATLIKCIIDK